MATTAAPNRIKDKARELLAKAEDPTTSEQDAQAFTAQAAELLATQALTAAVARATKKQKPEMVTRLDYTVSGQGYHGQARGLLVHAVAQSYGCEVNTSRNPMNGQDRDVPIIGTVSALDALSILLQSVVKQAEHHSKIATKAHMAKVGAGIDTAANKNIARRNHLRSSIHRYGSDLADKLTTMRAHLAKTVTNSAAVITADAERVQQHYAERFPTTDKKTRTTTTTTTTSTTGPDPTTKSTAGRTGRPPAKKTTTAKRTTTKPAEATKTARSTSRVRKSATK